MPQEFAFHLWNINGKIVTLYGYVCRSLVANKNQSPRQMRNTQRFAASVVATDSERTTRKRRKVIPGRPRVGKEEGPACLCAKHTQHPCLCFLFTRTHPLRRVVTGTAAAQGEGDMEACRILNFALFVIPEPIYSQHKEQLHPLLPGICGEVLGTCYQRKRATSV